MWLSNALPDSKKEVEIYEKKYIESNVNLAENKKQLFSNMMPQKLYVKRRRNRQRKTTSMKK